MLLLTTGVLLLLVRFSRGACNCYGCTSTQTVSTSYWLPAPSACSDPSEALVVSELRIASTDGQRRDVLQHRGGHGRQHYRRDMRLQVTCKNKVLSCPLTYDVQYACRKLDSCPCPACKHNTSVAAGSADQLDPQLKCTNGVYLEKLQVRSLNAGTVSPDLFTVRVRTDPAATTYLIGPSSLVPSSCFTYSRTDEYIDSENIYVFLQCENTERPCLLEYVGEARCREPPPAQSSAASHGPAAVAMLSSSHLISSHLISSSSSSSHHHLISPHLISSHLISSHLISSSSSSSSSHLTSPHLTSRSPHFTSLLFTSLHFTSLHFTALHLISPHITSPHLTSLHFT
eukprot:g28330.t1